MDGNEFDRIVRTLGRRPSRRRLLAALGAVVLPGTAPAPAASQIALSACGEAGAVCTLIRGCCTGLVCATSYINTSYGVCVTGEGGMLAVSDDIVVPSSAGIEEELAQEVADVAASAATVTDPAAERQARIDAKRAKKDTRRTTRKSTHATRRTTKDTRRTTRRLNEPPQITLELVPQQESVSGSVVTVHPETVRVRNFDDVAVVLTRIEAMFHPHNFSTLSVTIPVGGTHVLHSGPNASTSAWTRHLVCPHGGGVIVTAQHSGGTQPHLFSVPCGATVSSVNTETGHRHRRKRAQERRQRRRDHRRKARERRRDHKR